MSKAKAAAKNTTKKNKLADGFDIPIPHRAPVPEEAARRFEQKGEPAAAPVKHGPVATSRMNLRVHPDTYNATNDYAYEERLTQKQVIVQGLAKLGIKVAPSDLE